MTGPVWSIGLGGRAPETRSMPGEPDAIRTERVLRAQESWEPRTVATGPDEIFREWLINPANRMSNLAFRMAEDPSLTIEHECVGSGSAPRPGGLVERARQEAAQRVAMARAAHDARARAAATQARGRTAPYDLNASVAGPSPADDDWPLGR